MRPLTLVCGALIAVFTLLPQEWTRVGMAMAIGLGAGLVAGAIAECWFNRSRP
jgi:hypothetical protein